MVNDQHAYEGQSDWSGPEDGDLDWDEDEEMHDVS